MLITVQFQMSQVINIAIISTGLVRMQLIAYTGDFFYLEEHLEVGELLSNGSGVCTLNNYGLAIVGDNAIAIASNTNNQELLQFTHPIPLTMGSNTFGLLEITERREIVPSFLEMMGLTPVCSILVPQVPLTDVPQ
jgi:hypothetical protein